eukprot:5984048-Prymnesium_polylepis.1
MMIDLDTIDYSNLNRQFLFRAKHVSRSKAEVAREAVLEFPHDAGLKIQSEHANIKSQTYTLDFFKTFSIVLNALDNVDARRHVNRVCLAGGIPLIESGTEGYLGQARGAAARGARSARSTRAHAPTFSSAPRAFPPSSHSVAPSLLAAAAKCWTSLGGFPSNSPLVPSPGGRRPAHVALVPRPQVRAIIKGKTQCYECNPPPPKKSYPICTIRNHPDKPVHCIAWAKELLFKKLFGVRRARRATRTAAPRC